MDRYRGRVAVVTGAACGIGAAVARALLDRGVTVVGLDIRADRIKARAHEGGLANLHAIQVDVVDEGSVQAAFKWVRDSLGGADIVINCAGVFIEAELTSGPSDAWRRQLEVNVLGLSICTREAVQDMLDRGVDDGFIIHICSITGYHPPINSATAMYSATKHAVKCLLEGLRKDLVARKSNIRVGEVSPPAVNTEILLNNNSKTPDLFEKISHIEPEDVAAAVVYMLSQHPRVQVHDIIIHATCDNFM